MINFKKKLLATALICAVVSTSAIGAYAKTASYNTSTSQLILPALDNSNNNSSGGFSVSTRPTAGKGGACVQIVDVNGNAKYTKTFPYYETVSPLSASVPAKSIRYIRVKPAVSGETVKGTLNYDF